MNPFVFNTTPRLVVRPGATAEMCAFAGALPGRRIVFVTGRGILAHGPEEADAPASCPAAR